MFKPPHRSKPAGRSPHATARAHWRVRAWPQSRSRSRSLLLALVAATAMATAGLGVWAAQDGLTAQRGQAVFEGRTALVAHLPQQPTALPALATACANCHSGADPLGGALTRHTLAQPVARRGGPASTYDAGSLCRALAEGVDPAQVVLPRAMPRYQVTARDCAALWAHLMQRAS